MKFFREFITHPMETGAIVSSSAKLAKLIVGISDLSKKRCVVELGPGTGTLTKEILQRISPETSFFSLEINGQFVKATQRNCPNATIYHASALEIKRYLIQHNQNTCDSIISALPWGIFGQNLQEKLLESIYESLDDGGEFLTIAYIFGLISPPGIRFRELLNKRFRKVRRSKIIWGNVFPAFVYHCVK